MVEWDIFFYFGAIFSVVFVGWGRVDLCDVIHLTSFFVATFFTDCGRVLYCL